MGDIVPFRGAETAGSSSALVTSTVDPEAEEEARQQRIKEADALEAKLRYINETVPTKIYNVMGSGAGAGSGDFHQYRITRRNEQMRQKKMEEDWQKQQDEAAFEGQRREREEAAVQRTAKRRAKREKKKMRKKQKGAAGKGDGRIGEGASSEGSSEAEDDNAAAAPQPALD